MNQIIIQLGSIVISLINIYMWVIIITALLTWVNPDPRNKIVQILYRLTEPAYTFVRRFIPTIFNGIDLAPLIIIVVLQVVTILLSSALNSLIV